MRSVKYGHKTIDYSLLEKEGLKSHYITVEKDVGVILKGRQIPTTKSDALVLSKAKWIIDKLKLVEAISEHDIVTGSRVQYLGRRYYVEVIVSEEIESISIDFNESKFKVSTPEHLNTQSNIKTAFENYLRIKAEEKILPRIEKWSKTTGLNYTDAKVRKLHKRWGSCTTTNKIIINIDAIKLPYSLIDYLIVHELVHTQIKSHSKEFWSELSQHINNWKELDDRMYGMKL